VNVSDRDSEIQSGITVNRQNFHAPQMALEAKGQRLQAVREYIRRFAAARPRASQVFDEG
jgi:hypothetical protein